jgi:hypothetical protein
VSYTDAGYYPNRFTVLEKLSHFCNMRLLNKSRGLLLPFIVIICFIAGTTSCKKEKVLTSGGTISFSIDTLMFDTVFTAQGSSTRKLLIRNTQKEKITLSSIRFRQGEKSAYRLNINGTPGTEVRNVDIAGNDSVWVFAAVTVDPTDENTPFVVTDELVATLNGQEFSIPVFAYGQNAYYIVDSILNTQTWLTDKPYVILRNALVDTDQTLTIPAGCRVHVHQDSRLFVLGTLKIQGTADKKVTFLGDRLDPLVWIGDYLDIPGQWGGLYFDSLSHDNEIDHAIFKNGGAPTRLGESVFAGATIQVNLPVVGSSTAPKLKISNSIIKSSLGNGILAYRSSIDATNCLIIECGGENVALLEGGKYNFDYCTIATYGSTYLSHTQNVSTLALNYRMITQTRYESAPLEARFRNCILTGSLRQEVFFDRKPDHNAQISVSNSILTNDEAMPDFIAESNNKYNVDPLFIDRIKDDYHVADDSPAKRSAAAIPGVSSDIEGNTRDDSNPTIGCYE